MSMSDAIIWSCMSLLQCSAHAALGAVSGAIGAKILIDAGYEGYSVLETTRAGAVGNIIMGAGVGCIKACTFFNRPSRVQQDGTFIALTICEGVASVGTTILGGVLGRVMINTIAEMPLSKIAAAMAVGNGALIAAITVLALMIACCYYLNIMCNPKAVRGEILGLGTELNNPFLNTESVVASSFSNRSQSRV